jgi:hypothetical protein
MTAGDALDVIQRDGAAETALFDTPCAVVATATGELLIADTGNNLIRKPAPGGQVTTLTVKMQRTTDPGEMTLTDEARAVVSLVESGVKSYAS